MYQTISRTAQFDVHAQADRTFSLLTPEGERLWVPGWQPCYLFPEDGNTCENMVFQTKGRYPGESHYTWTLTHYDPQNHLSKYLIFTMERVWRVVVSVKEIQNNLSRVEVTYAFTGLTPNGEKLNKMALKDMFAHDLQDWAELIQNYLNLHPQP